MPRPAVVHGCGPGGVVGAGAVVVVAGAVVVEVGGARPAWCFPPLHATSRLSTTTAATRRFIDKYLPMPYQRMTDDEVRAFLTSTPPHTGKLATVRADGRPHVAPVWYVLDEADGTIVFTTGEDTVKGRNLRRSGYTAMCVDDERPPFSFVTLEGPVTLSDDLDQLRHWVTLIGGRYMGAERAGAFAARNAVPGELLARLTPARVTSAKDVAD